MKSSKGRCVQKLLKWERVKIGRSQRWFLKNIRASEQFDHFFHFPMVIMIQQVNETDHLSLSPKNSPNACQTQKTRHPLGMFIWLECWTRHPGCSSGKWSCRAAPLLSSLSTALLYIFNLQNEASTCFSINGTLQQANIAGWKMDPDWRCISYWTWGYYGYCIAMLVYLEGKLVLVWIPIGSPYMKGIVTQGGTPLESQNHRATGG